MEREDKQTRTQTVAVVVRRETKRRTKGNDDDDNDCQDVGSGDGRLVSHKRPAETREEEATSHDQGTQHTQQQTLRQHLSSLSHEHRIL